MRYARNINRLEAERYRESIILEYMNASLQRAKRMPTLKSLLAKKDKAPPSKASIVDRIKAAHAANSKTKTP